MNYLWKLAPGCRPEKLALTDPLAAPAPGITWQPAEIDAAEHRWMVTKALEIRDRVAPWVTLYLGPWLYHHGTGLQGFGGWQGYGGEEYATVSLARGTGCLADTCYHELFHALEARLTSEVLAVITLSIERSTELYGPDAYRADPYESRAHAFSRLACALDSMPGQLLIDTSLPTAASCFSQIWNGEWAAAEMRRHARAKAA